MIPLRISNWLNSDVPDPALVREVLTRECMDENRTRMLGVAAAVSNAIALSQINTSSTRKDRK